MIFEEVVGLVNPEVQFLLLFNFVDTFVMFIYHLFDAVIFVSKFLDITVKTEVSRLKDVSNPHDNSEAYVRVGRNTLKAMQSIYQATHLPTNLTVFNVDWDYINHFTRIIVFIYQDFFENFFFIFEILAHVFCM